MERFNIHTQPINNNIVLERNHVRISLLTSRLLRVEKGHFTDLATQTVLFRDLGTVLFSSEYRGNLCIIRTDHAVFHVNFKSAKVVGIELSDGRLISNFSAGNLRGTARTLDMTNGAIKLEHGILSRSGVSVMDDSTSLLLTVDGKILPRPD